MVRSLLVLCGSFCTCSGCEVTEGPCRRTLKSASPAVSVVLVLSLEVISDKSVVFSLELMLELDREVEALESLFVDPPASDIVDGACVVVPSSISMEVSSTTVVGGSDESEAVDAIYPARN